MYQKAELLVINIINVYVKKCFKIYNLSPFKDTDALALTSGDVRSWLQSQGLKKRVFKHLTRILSSYYVFLDKSSI